MEQWNNGAWAGVEEPCAICMSSFPHHPFSVSVYDAPGTRNSSGHMMYGSSRRLKASTRQMCSLHDWVDRTCFKYIKHSKKYKWPEILSYPFLLPCISQLLMLKMMAEGKERMATHNSFSFQFFLTHQLAKVECAHIKNLIFSPKGKKKKLILCTVSTVPIRTKYICMHELWNINWVVPVILQTC